MQSPTLKLPKRWLKVVIIDRDPLRREILATIFRLKEKVAEVHATDNIQSAEQALEQGFNSAVIDIFEFGPNDGTKIIEHMRKSFPRVTLCLHSKIDQLEKMPGVDAYWQRRFAHYFKLEKNPNVDHLNDGVEDLIVQFSWDLWDLIGSTPIDPPSPNKPKSLSTQERTELRELMVECFDVDDVEDICFDLHIDSGVLSGDQKKAKIRSLILYCERLDKLKELISVIRKLRPHLSQKKVLQY